MPERPRRRTLVLGVTFLAGVLVVVVTLALRIRSGDDPVVAPDGGVAADVLDRAAPAAVHVTGEACFRTQAGSGVVVASGLVVTNAHVVAGTAGVEVVSVEGVRLTGEVVAFDPDRDLAVVRAEGIEAMPLSPAPSVLPTGLVLGVPDEGPVEPVPYRVVREVRLRATDIYGDHPVERQVLELLASIRFGDSGGALLDPNGELAGIVFAVNRDGEPRAFALAVTEVTALLDQPLDTPVGTGACL